MTTRINRRVSVNSEYAAAKVLLYFFDERVNAWVTAPAHYAFYTDAQARAFANGHYRPGVRIRTTEDETESVTV